MPAKRKRRRSKKRYLDVMKENMQEVAAREDGVFGRRVWSIPYGDLVTSNPNEEEEHAPSGGIGPTCVEGSLNVESQSLGFRTLSLSQRTNTEEQCLEQPRTIFQSDSQRQYNAFTTVDVDTE